MKLHAKTRPDTFAASDTVTLFLSEGYDKEGAKQIPAQLAFLSQQCDLSFFRAKQGESLFLPFKDRPSVILIGIGKREEVSRESLRNAAAPLAGISGRRKIRRLLLIPPVLPKWEEADIVRCLAEGLYLSHYSFTKYKTRKEENLKKIDDATFLTEAAGITALLTETEILCANTLACRDLINEISDNSHPLAIAAEARKLSKIRGVSCRVFGKREIEKMKMGLLSAVSRGSHYPPQLVVLQYRGNPRSRKTTALVGKGITFDSGGLNLKPSGHIEDMRSDMSGAAACLYALKAAAELRLKVNVTAVIPLCDNMLASHSYRPGDVYRAYNGKTVEIGNTDAEGRLILADAIAYTVDKIKPERIIDVATLTGACLICFGEIVAGLLSTNDDLAARLFEAGEKSGDRMWRLPLYREYDDDIKSDIADINNIAAGRKAGTIIGAVFLKNFAGKIPWAHIDIAGTAWYSKNRGYRPKYATGYGVRLFVELLKNLPD